MGRSPSEPKQPPLVAGDADSPEEAGSRTCLSPRSCVPGTPCRPAPPPAAGARNRGWKTGLASAVSRLHLCPHEAAPASIAPWKRRGPQGGARSCRRPPGPVGTREECSFLCQARPARAAGTHPGLADCKAWGRGAALSTSCRRPPTSTPDGTWFPSVYKRASGRSWHVQAWPTVHTQGLGAQWGCPPHLGGPSSLPSLTPDLGTHSGVATSWGQWLSAGGEGRLHTLPSSQRRQTPQGSTHARTDSHPAPPAHSPASQPRNAVGG